MHDCVVDQKLSYLYMCSNACMLAANVCMHVAHMSKNYRFNLHDVQLALHKRNRNKWSKNGFHTTSRDVEMVPPIK